MLEVLLAAASVRCATSGACRRAAIMKFCIPSAVSSMSGLMALTPSQLAEAKDAFTKLNGASLDRSAVLSCSCEACGRDKEFDEAIHALLKGRCGTFPASPATPRLESEKGGGGHDRPRRTGGDNGIQARDLREFIKGLRKKRHAHFPDLLYLTIAWQ